jgi:hypothetical protein
MSALSFAFMASVDLVVRQSISIMRSSSIADCVGFRGRVPRDDFGRTPCIPPAILRGMVDRILTRARVERDNREEAQPSR